jgi:alanine racemase
MKAESSDENNDGNLATVRVRADNILHNFSQYAQDTKIAPVLKSNAYGHGLEVITDIIANRTDVPLISLAAYREAKRLRESGREIPVLIIGYTPPEIIQKTPYENLHFTISTLDQLKELSENLTVPRTFHLKVETGMHRYGVKLDDLQTAVDLIEHSNCIELVGAFTHFSDAYSAESEYTKKQITRWNDAIGKLQTALDITYRHVSATSGHFYREDINQNIQRIGIGLYGITDYAADKDLKPALSLHSFVAGTKRVAAGGSVGYSQSFRAPNDMKIAVIPIGYQEAVDRHLSNAGCVQINDSVCPIVGKVNMNATMVDISDVDAQSRDPVEIYSADPQAPNSLLNQADTAGTIPYDILTGISPELERSVV